MAVRDFFAQDARGRVAAAVRAAESHTAAEIVVAVHRRSGEYRHVDMLVGFGASLAGLMVFLFHPQEFELDWYPLESIGIFAAAALLSSALPALRRALTRPSWRVAQVRKDALSTFMELGVDRTGERTGILVLVSALEREASIVCDRGIDEAALGEPWKNAIAEVHAAARGKRPRGGDLEQLCKSIEAMGRALEKTYPRRDDDINELPDEARVA